MRWWRGSARGVLLKRGAYQFGAVAHDQAALDLVARPCPSVMQSLRPGPRRGATHDRRSPARRCRPADRRARAFSYAVHQSRRLGAATIRRVCAPATRMGVRSTWRRCWGRGATRRRHTLRRPTIRSRANDVDVGFRRRAGSTGSRVRRGQSEFHRTRPCGNRAGHGPRGDRHQAGGRPPRG